MKKHALLTVVCLLGGISLSCAQAISKADSLEIVGKIDDWNRAWKIKDASLAAKWYTADADFTNAFGFTMNGRSSIEEYLTGVFALDFVMAGDSEQTSMKLKKISDHAVLAISTISRQGQRQSDGAELGNRSTTHHRLFLKNGEWKITAHLISDARSIETSRH